MTIGSRSFLAVVFALTALSSVLLADDLSGFQEVYASGSKAKDAEIVYLKPDASMGQKSDPEAKPAIKLDLLKDQEHFVMKDFTTADDVKEIDVAIDVCASLDFRHNKGDENWGPGVYYSQEPIHPNVDFWSFLTPGFGYKLTNLERGKWSNVEARLNSPRASKLHHIEFHVPAGTGFIYLQNFTITPKS